MALVGRGADNWIASHARSCAATIGTCACVAVATGRSIRCWRGRAGSVGGITCPSDVTRVRGRADNRAAANACTRLARIESGAGVAVRAHRAIGCKRIRAHPRCWITTACDMALICWRTRDRVVAHADTRLTGVDLRARIAVGTSGAVERGGVRAGARSRIARAGDVTLIGGGTHDWAVDASAEVGRATARITHIRCTLIGVAAISVRPAAVLVQE